MHCSIFPGNATLLTSNRKMHYAEEQLLSTFKSLVSEWMAWFLFSPPQSCPKDTSPSHQQNVRQLCLVSRFISSSQKKINNFRLSSLCYYNSLLKRYYYYIREASLVAQWWRTCQPMQETWVRPLGQEDPLEKELTTHSSILAWEIPWTEGA